MSLLRNLTMSAVLLATPCLTRAHFQVLYTPETVIAPGASTTVVVDMIFTHPFDGGEVMDMGKGMDGALAESDVTVVQLASDAPVGKFKLEPVDYSTDEDSGRGYRLEFENTSMGDLAVCCDPGNYWEPLEDCYIRQITKLVVNRAGLATGWEKPVGLKAEIVPMDPPYALWTGNVFRGQVLCNGSPVPNAEIEVEHLNFDIQGDALVNGPKVTAPHDALVTQTIRADAEGRFAYGIPRAGWWGFAAINLADDLELNGKPVELGAVIWIQARDME